MQSGSPQANQDERPADRFARLLEMGFERVEPGPQTTESLRLDADTWKVSQIAPAMGSFVAVSALHASRDLAEHAIGVAFEEMQRVIGLLNRFDDASALAVLNDSGRLADSPPELTRVVADGLAFHRATGGAFDITVKPIIDLYRDPRSYEPRTPPGNAELRDALELLGPEHVSIEDRAVGLGRTGMGLTLDGIAKGFIVDAMAAQLASCGVERFLVNAGGDIRTAGDRGDDSPWTIAVRDPGEATPSWDSRAWQRAVVPDLIQVTDGAVATSGSYEIYFDRDRQAHHIVEGATGRSPCAALSVTVTAATTMQADALATAAFVLGPEAGRRLIDGIDGCECLIIDRDGARRASRGWRATQRRCDV